jgi:hypothetical protein
MINGIKEDMNEHLSEFQENSKCWIMQDMKEEFWNKSYWHSGNEKFNKLNLKTQLKIPSINWIKFKIEYQGSKTEYIH